MIWLEKRLNLVMRVDGEACRCLSLCALKGTRPDQWAVWLGTLTKHAQSVTEHHVSRTQRRKPVQPLSRLGLCSAHS